MPIKWHVRGPDRTWQVVEAGFTTYCCSGFHPVSYLTASTCGPVLSL